MIKVANTSGPRRNPLDYTVRPDASLFDRIQRPRNPRISYTPSSSSDDDNYNRRRRGRRNGRRSDVSKPPPSHIDRYVPPPGRTPGRAPGRRFNGDRRQSERRDGRNNTAGAGKMVNGRPRKTQEELDQEMEDYWDNSTPVTNGGGAAAPSSDAPTAPATEANGANGANGTNGANGVNGTNGTSEAAPSGTAADGGAGGAAGDGDVDMIE